MTFLVFTFADGLLRGIIQGFSFELFLYVILWLFLTIQATFAYLRIEETDPDRYPTKAMVSDCIDILIAIYICAAMGGVFGRGTEYDLHSYLHLSIPFLILSINQFLWFVFVKNFDIPAIFRIIILFSGMLVISISETINHNLWNLVAVVLLIVLLGIFRAINKAPALFSRCVINLWNVIKRKRKPNDEA